MQWVAPETLPPPAPCHSLSAQGSAPNTPFRNTRVCHRPQENGNVFLTLENQGTPRPEGGSYTSERVV